MLCFCLLNSSTVFRFLTMPSQSTRCAHRRSRWASSGWTGLRFQKRWTSSCQTTPHPARTDRRDEALHHTDALDSEEALISASSYPEIDHWHVAAVWFPHDGCQVLQVRGQEGPVGWCQAHGASLLVALEVRSPDAAHVSLQRSIQSYKMQLRQKTFLRTEGNHEPTVPSFVLFGSCVSL